MLADIAIGIFSAFFTSYLFQVKPSFSLLLVGIFFALLPDIDFLIEWIRGRKPLGRFERDHRNLFHYPLFYILIGSIFVFWFSWAYLFLFVINSLWHFIHDSIWVGWGVKWLYPFSKKRYKFDKPLKRPGKENWIKEIYFRPTVVSITESLLFFSSLIVYLVYLKQ